MGRYKFRIVGFNPLGFILFILTAVVIRWMFPNLHLLLCLLLGLAIVAVFTPYVLAIENFITSRFK